MEYDFSKLTKKQREKIQQEIVKEDFDTEDKLVDEDDWLDDNYEDGHKKQK